MTRRAACLLMVLEAACGETALRDRNPVGADAGRVDVAHADSTAEPTGDGLSGQGTPDAAPPTPTPPTTYQGFGATAAGGAASTIYLVTSLKDTGAPGTLRDAVAASGRTIRFAVAGTIHLAADLVIKASHLTIDGTTAPAPGITIADHSTVLEGDQRVVADQASHIIIRGLRLRGGSDSLRLWRNCHDIVVDHCSFSGSGDGACDITEGVFNVTFSWNLVSAVPSGKAMLIKYEASHVSVHHNLWVKNAGRNPQAAGDRRYYSTGPAPETPVADIRHNVVWGYDYATVVRGLDDHPASANVVSNLYSASPGGVHASNHIIAAGPHALHAAGNVTLEDCRTATQFMSNLKVTSANSMSNSPEHPVAPVSGPAPTDAAGRLAEWAAVLKGAGPSMFADDAVDAAARAAVALPGVEVFGAPWNDG